MFYEDFPNNGRIILGKNYVPTIPNNNLTDNTGQETHVAGIIIAQTNNVLGIAGICFNSELFISKEGDKNKYVNPLESSAMPLL